jgi:hypothetical protein
MTDLSVRSDLPTIDMAKILDELRPLSPAKLFACFDESLGATAFYFARAAGCVFLLKERGEDTSHLKMVGVFLRIASGQILPEITAMFMRYASVRVRVEQLPLPDQRRLVTNPMVLFARPLPGGGFDSQMIDLTKAAPVIVKQVIGPDGIRSLEEQQAHIVMEQSAETAKALRPKRKQVVHRRNIRFDLTEDTDQAIRVAAAKSGVSEGGWILECLFRHGELKRPKS